MKVTKRNLRKKMIEMDIGISELSEYLDISRPTLYKFIDLYEAGNFNKINKEVLKLFNYIVNNDFIGRNNVINYILKKIINISENVDFKDIYIEKIVNYLNIDENINKSFFIYDLITNKNFESLIIILEYLTKVRNKKIKTNYEKKNINSFNEFINKFAKEIKNE